MINIIGAGLSGLIAGDMLRKLQPVIYEKQKELPNNHHAVLRFRSDQISLLTGIPFKKVRVTKGIVGDFSPIQAMNLYSRKVIGRYANRSVMSLEPVDRFICPPDFISKISNGLDIQFNHPLDPMWATRKRFGKEVVKIISTMPLPILLQELKIEHETKFEFQEGFTIRTRITYPICDINQTIYYPGLLKTRYRASITGNELFIEHMGKKENRVPLHDMDGEVETVLNDFGLAQCVYDVPEIKTNNYMKIKPVNDAWRKAMLFRLTSEFGIYSLGRYATWRPSLLLDDLVQDVQKIHQWINEDNYGMKKDER